MCSLFFPQYYVVFAKLNRKWLCMVQSVREYNLKWVGLEDTQKCLCYLFFQCQLFSISCESKWTCSREGSCCGILTVWSVQCSAQHADGTQVWKFWKHCGCRGVAGRRRSVSKCLVWCSIRFKILTVKQIIITDFCSEGRGSMFPRNTHIHL